MTPSSWSRRRLVAFWLAAAAVSVLCLIVGRLRNPSWDFAIALPYDGSMRSIPGSAATVVLGAFVVRPWEATALVGVPVVVITVSLVWIVARRRARRAA